MKEKINLNVISSEEGSVEPAHVAPPLIQLTINRGGNAFHIFSEEKRLVNMINEATLHSLPLSTIFENICIVKFSCLVFSRILICPSTMINIY